MAEQSRLEIAIDSRQAERNVQNVRSELEQLERASDGTVRATDGVASSFDDAARSAGLYYDSAGRLRAANGRFATSAERAQVEAGQLSSQLNVASGGFRRLARNSQLAVPPIGDLTALMGTLSGYLGVQQIIRYADTWQNAANQLRMVTEGADELAGTQERLMQVANDTRSDFASTANLYSRLARSTTELGLSQRDLLGLTTTINRAFAVSGTTTEEAAGAITQLSQGLAAGALRGDEFNSVAEQAPSIMRAIADELDMTIGELREFAAEGGITANIVVRALESASGKIEGQFSQAVATFGQNMTVARNNLIEFVGASDTVEGALANLGETAITLSENLDEVAQVGTLLAGAVAGRLIGRMVAVTAGLTTAAGAATALRTALAFLGGPAGVAVLAASGLYAFREELGRVPSPAREAREEIELLTGSLDDLNASSIDAAMIAINAQMFDLERRAREARATIDELQDQSGSGALGMAPGVTGGMARAQSELGEISAQRSALAGRQEELLALREGLDRAGDAGDEASSSLERLGQTADDVVAKFKPMLNQDIENILDRAGEGATIDANGQIRDAWGNFNRVLQGELEAAVRDQQNAFTSEQNLQAGLEALLGGGSQNRPGGLLATGEQDNAPALAKPMGTFTIKVAKEGGETTEGQVQGDEDFIRRLAGALGSAASAV